MDGKTIKARFEGLVSDRQIVQEIWDRLEMYVLPLGGGRFFQSLHSEGEIDWRRREIYDDTAIEGCDSLAASIHGSLTSPAVKWFDFHFRTNELNDDIEARQWLDEAGEITWGTLQDSNFNLEVSEGYLNLCGLGNMGLSHEPKDDLNWDGMVFDNIPLRELYFEEDHRGQILRLYRLLSWRVTKIVDKFGYTNVPENIRQAYDNPTLCTNKIDIIFCIYPEMDNAGADTSTVLAVEKRPYQFKYILRSSGEQLGNVGGYHEMPAYAVRWRRTAGSQWGYGPGHIALSTVMTLNDLIKLVLKAGEKVIDPPALVQRRGLLSDLDLSPGGKTVVKASGMVEAYESRARFDVSWMSAEDLRNMIRRLFHVDQLQLKESPAMSATEVMVRYELMNRLLGPTMGRLQNDLLDPLVTNTFRMLYRAKQIKPMPDAVREAGGIVDIEYVGPLARAQKLDESASIERWLGNIATLAEAFPSVRNIPDVVAVVKGMADNLNVNAKYINADGVISQLNAKDAQIQELMQQLEAAVQASTAERNMAQANRLQAAV